MRVTRQSDTLWKKKSEYAGVDEVCPFCKGMSTQYGSRGRPLKTKKFTPGHVYDFDYYSVVPSGPKGPYHDNIWNDRRYALEDTGLPEDASDDDLADKMYQQEVERGDRPRVPERGHDRECRNCGSTWNDFDVRPEHTYNEMENYLENAADPYHWSRLIGGEGGIVL